MSKANFIKIEGVLVNLDNVTHIYKTRTSMNENPEDYIRICFGESYESVRSDVDLEAVHELIKRKTK